MSSVKKILANRANGGDSGEAERSIRTEAERHSGINPNTIGAFARSVQLRQEKPVRSEAQENASSEERVRGQDGTSCPRRSTQ